MKFVESQLPSIGKLINKLQNKKTQKSKKIEDQEEDDLFEEDEVTDISGISMDDLAHEDELMSAIENTDQIELSDDKTGEIKIDDSFLPEDEETIDEIEEEDDLEIDLEEVDDEEENESKSIIGKKLSKLPLGLKNINFLKKFTPKKKNNEANNDDIEEELDEDIDRPKAKIKPIHLVVIIGLLALFYDDFMPSTEEPVEEVQVKSIKKPYAKDLKKEKDIKKDIKAAQETKKEAEPITNNETTTNLEAKTEVAAEVEVKEVETKETKESNSELEDLFADDSLTLPSDKVDQEIEPLPPLEETPSTGQTTLPDKAPDLDNTLINSDDSSIISEDVLKDLEQKVKSQEKVEDVGKMTKPVAAPDYENIGRGLVFNCVGKHWACIDDSSYNTCVKNKKWNSQNNLKVECHPYEIYIEDLDCTQMQQFQIDTIADTDFCN